jgi:hypothetical protein
MSFDTMPLRAFSVVLFTVTMALASSDATSQVVRTNPLGVSAAEAIQLPKFCWGEFLDVKGPEYWIQGCGDGMNHYCEGLVELMRANKSFGDQHVRITRLKRARHNTLYTITAMRNFPTCWLRPHAEATRQQIDTALRVYGVR